VTRSTDSKKPAERANSAFHRQKRAQITRQELLQSAREIFARDGFEHARLEDIASSIGKTRGALYDHFKNKEEVFFAIFEQDVERDHAELARILAKLPTVEKQIQGLVEYLIEVSQDCQRMLLDMEFKLYAIRHPEERQRLAELHDAMLLQISVPEVNALLLNLGRRSRKAQRIGCLALGGIVDGLVLNHLFDPKIFDGRQLTQYLKPCLRRLLERDLEAKRTRAKRRP